MRTRMIAAAAAAALATTLSACGGDSGAESAAEGESESESESYPTEDLDWTVAFGPGGGNDIMSRTLVDILEKHDLYPHNITVTNREGGSGATGWGYLLNQRGDGHAISSTSGSFITTPLQADTGWTYEDFTPVGLLATDNLLFVVPADSGIETWEDWVAHAKDKGRAVVGGIGTVNVDFIVHQMLADAEGYEIEYVPFNEEGQVQTSLLSGALDASVSNPGEILGQVEAGEVTPLLFTGVSPLEVLPDVPTGEEVGIDELPSMPRGLILAPEAPEEAQEWWINTMKEVVETEEWQEYLDSNHLTENIKWGEDFQEYLGETTNEFQRILEEAGAL